MHNFQRTSQHSLRERSSCKTKTNTAWFCWDKNDEKNRRNLLRAIQWNLGALLWWSLLFLCLFSDSLDLKKKTNKQTAIGVERNRAIFTQVWKVIRDRIGFALLRYVIGPENSRHSLRQWDAKFEPISTWSPSFSRVLGSLVVFTLNSHWFFILPYTLLATTDPHRSPLKTVWSAIPKNLPWR